MPLPVSTTSRFAGGVVLTAAAAVLAASCTNAAPPGVAPAAPAAAADRPDAALQAVLDLYHEASDDLGRSGRTAATAAVFYREWHDRIMAVAADAPRSELKAQLLNKASVLSYALSDLPAAAAEARASIAASDDEGYAIYTRMHLANVEQVAALRSPGVAERVAALAAFDDFQAAAERAPEGKRDSIVRVQRVHVAKAAAGLRTDLGEDDAAVAEYDAALRFLADVASDEGLRFLMPDTDPTPLEMDRAAALVRAGDAGAAAAAIDAIAGRTPIPKSLIAAKVGSSAGLGGPGGTFLLDWLESAPADDYSVRAKAAVAFALDDADRDADALPLLLDLRENHAGDLANLEAGVMGQQPYASVLVRLGTLLADRGMTDLAAEVAGEAAERYPDDGRLYMLDRGIEAAKARIAGATPR